LKRQWWLNWPRHSPLSVKHKNLWQYSQDPILSQLNPSLSQFFFKSIPVLSLVSQDVSSPEGYLIQEIIYPNKEVVASDGLVVAREENFPEILRHNFTNNHSPVTTNCTKSKTDGKTRTSSFSVFQLSLSRGKLFRCFRTAWMFHSQIQFTTFHSVAAAMCFTSRCLETAVSSDFWAAGSVETFPRQRIRT
jgi:hypothetical protein